jgi:hypothetical protein
MRAIVTTACLVVLAATSCGETLEVCAPCGSVADGDVNISGDPRIDGTFDAVRGVRLVADEARAALEEDTRTLAAAFGAPVTSRDPITPEEAAAVAAAVAKALLSGDGPALATVEYEPAQCFANTQMAVKAQVACEDRSDCAVSDGCADKAASCTGLCEGVCLAGCAGQCFSPAQDAGADCQGACIGACGGVSDAPCPGRCVGTCTGACSAYEAGGGCAGRCDGLCTGECESATPATCAGQCTGECRVPAARCTSKSGECRGSCPVGGCLGRCRGHVKPAGCDRPDRCTGVGECQDMARGLAWAYLECAPASIRVGLDVAQGEERAPWLARAKILERVLGRTAGLHAALALLVDGADDGGGITAGDLNENLSPDELGPLADPAFLKSMQVAEARLYLPLENLKARAGLLAEQATSGDFKISAGSLPCVQPALSEALADLQALLPTVEGPSGALVADRTGGLYALVDAQAAILGLAVPGSGGAK